MTARRVEVETTKG